jgi:flavoprotein
MLLCNSCNRAKSWSCEHCENWLTKKSSEICLACYWGNPEDYSHIALREIRRIDLIWEDAEVRNYEKLKKLAKAKKYKIPNYVKKILVKHLGNNSA